MPTFQQFIDSLSTTVIRGKMAVSKMQRTLRHLLARQTTPIGIFYKIGATVSVKIKKGEFGLCNVRGVRYVLSTFENDQSLKKKGLSV